MRDHDVLLHSAGVIVAKKLHDPSGLRKCVAEGFWSLMLEPGSQIFITQIDVLHAGNRCATSQRSSAHAWRSGVRTTFLAYSWLHEDQGERPFFPSVGRLPSDTPPALQGLRRRELLIIQVDPCFLINQNSVFVDNDDSTFLVMIIILR
jgi:hypothetical protein